MSAFPWRSMSLVTSVLLKFLIICIAGIQFRKKNDRQRPHTLYCTYIRRKLPEGHTQETHSAKEVVAGVLAVELACAVKAEIAADTVGVGRGARTARDSGKEGGTAKFAGKAHVDRSAGVTCTQNRSNPHWKYKKRHATHRQLSAATTCHAVPPPVYVYCITPSRWHPGPGHAPKTCVSPGETLAFSVLFTPAALRSTKRMRRDQ